MQLNTTLGTRWEGGEEDWQLHHMLDAEQTYNAGIKECPVHFPNNGSVIIPKINVKVSTHGNTLYENVD